MSSKTAVRLSVVLLALVGAACATPQQFTGADGGDGSGGSHSGERGTGGIGSSSWWLRDRWQLTVMSCLVAADQIGSYFGSPQDGRGSALIRTCAM